MMSTPTPTNSTFRSFVASDDRPPESTIMRSCLDFMLTLYPGSPVNRVRSVLWIRSLSRKPFKGIGSPETLSLGTFTSVHPNLRSKLRRRRIREGTAHKLRPHRLLRLRDQLGFHKTTRTLITPLLRLLAALIRPGL